MVDGYQGAPVKCAKCLRLHGLGGVSAGKSFSSMRDIPMSAHIWSTGWWVDGRVVILADAVASSMAKRGSGHGNAESLFGSFTALSPFVFCPPCCQRSWER